MSLKDCGMVFIIGIKFLVNKKAMVRKLKKESSSYMSINNTVLLEK